MVYKIIKPKPFKYKCQECGYSKVIKPKSDVINPMALNNIYPKCKLEIKRETFNILDKLLR